MEVEVWVARSNFKKELAKKISTLWEKINNNMRQDLMEMLLKNDLNSQKCQVKVKMV